MLYLDAGLELQGLTIYRDYNDRERFYYLPRSPHLTMEGGQPMFQLLIYRRGGGGTVGADERVSGGGFLTMTVDLGVPQGTRDAVASELSSRFGVQAMLLPVPVEGGSVRISALDSTSGATDADANHSGPRFVEKIMASAKPSLYGDERTAFTAELSQEGATLMRAALSGPGATPIVVIYDLQFKGLHPAYECTIKIHFQQSYHYLRNRMQANTLWLRTDIDREMEELRKQGSIEIEEVKYETEEPSARADRLQKLQDLAKELAQWTFFKPGINPGQVLAQDRGSLTAADPTAALSAITQGLTSRSAAAFTGIGATEDVGPPRQPGVAVVTGPVGSGAQPNQPPRPTQPTQPPQSDTPTAVELWNRQGRPQAAFLMRDLSQEERQEITYHLRQVGTLSRSIAPQGQVRSFGNLAGRILDIDLNDPFFQTVEGTVTTTADLQALGVASMVVRLRYGVRPDGTLYKDTAEAVLGAKDDKVRYRFFVDGQRTPVPEYQVVITYKAGFAIGHDAVTEETPWAPMPARNLDVDPRQLSIVLRVELVAASVDWTLVKQIQAQVRYQDPAAQIQAATTRIFNPGSTSALVPVRPRDPGKKDVTVDATFFYSDGDSEVFSTTKGGDETFVINQPPDSATVVNLSLADPLRRYDKVVVQLSRAGDGDPQVLRTVTLNAQNPGSSWSFRRKTDADKAFRYQSTGFLRDGSVREQPWLTTQNPLVVLGDKAAGMLAVSVLLGASPASAGYRLAKLKLVYPAAPDWADGSVEKIFRTDADTFEWRVPMARLSARSYTYEVTWFGADGHNVHQGPETSSDETLILEPPAR